MMAARVARLTPRASKYLRGVLDHRVRAAEASMAARVRVEMAPAPDAPPALPGAVAAAAAAVMAAAALEAVPVPARVAAASAPPRALTVEVSGMGVSPCKAGGRGREAHRAMTLGEDMVFPPPHDDPAPFPDRAAPAPAPAPLLLPSPPRLGA